MSPLFSVEDVPSGSGLFYVHGDLTASFAEAAVLRYVRPTFPRSPFLLETTQKPQTQPTLQRLLVPGEGRARNCRSPALSA